MKRNIKNNLINCISCTEQMNIYFYQQNRDAGYQVLNDVLGSLMNVMEELTYLRNTNEIEIDINIINKMLESALQALESQDTVLFADIMQFEIVDLLKDINSGL
ncbi:hypothetical protein [Anaerosporobacter sp.]